MPTRFDLSRTSAAQSGLLGLPLELKQKIFRPLLIASRAINLELIAPANLPEWWMHVDKIDPWVMNVCPALRRAAATVLYQENTFRFWSPTQAHLFAKLVNAELVRSFAFMIEDSVSPEWCTYLEGKISTFSFRNDFLQVNDLELFFTRTVSDKFPLNVRNIQWELRKLDICDALIRNIMVFRTFRIDDMDIPRPVPCRPSNLEELVKRAMNGDRDLFEEYQWEIGYAAQLYVFST